MYPYEIMCLAALVAQLIITFVALVAASYYDLKKGIIPLTITMWLCVIGFFYSLFPDTMINIIIASVFLVIATPLYYKKVLGGGDIKLLIGILLMTPIMFITPMFYLVFGLTTGIAGLLLYVLFKYVLKRKALVENATIRFAPAMLIGWTIAAIYIIVGLL